MSKRLKELRKRHKFTQTEIAEFLKMPQGNYAFIESNKRQPTIAQLVKLKDLYKTSIDYMVLGN